MAELTKGDTQTTLHQFYVMKYEDGVRAAGVRSKRMKKALKRIHAPGAAADEQSSDSDVPLPRKNRGTKRARAKKFQPAVAFTIDDIDDETLLSIEVANGDSARPASEAQQVAQRAECLSSDSDRGSSTDEDLKIPKNKVRRRRAKTRR